MHLPSLKSSTYSALALDIAAALPHPPWTSDPGHYKNSDRNVNSDLNPAEKGRLLHSRSTVLTEIPSLLYLPCVPFQVINLLLVLAVIRRRRSVHVVYMLAAAMVIPDIIFYIKVRSAATW